MGFITNNNDKGLGDTIERFTQATGIKAATEAVSGFLKTDCGCQKRKDKLNKLVPYKKK